jgi:capsular exopolysaccharide synthesis family protein
MLMDKIITKDQQIETPELSLKDYIFLVRRGIKIIIPIVVLSVLYMLYYTYTVNPKYTASISILIEPPEAMDSFLFSTPGSFYMTGISNSIELMKSRRVATEVVKTLWDTEWRNNLEIFDTRKYKPKGQFLKNYYKEIISLGSFDPSSITPEKFENKYSNEIGRRFAPRIQSEIEVKSNRDTDILIISFTSSFREEAALIANSIADAYKKLDREFDSEEMTNLREFLVDQVDEKEKELFAVENQLKKYQENQNIFSLEGNADNMLKRLVEAEADYMESAALIKIKTEEKSFISNRLSGEERKLASQLSNSINARLTALRNELTIKEKELVRNTSMHGEEHDALDVLKNEIIGLNKKLSIETKKLIDSGQFAADPLIYRQELIKKVLEIDLELGGLSARASEQKKIVDRYTNELNQLPQKQLQFARLDRDRQVLDKIYSYMRQKLEETQISVAAESGKSRIIDRAIPPDFPKSPRHSRNILLGGVLGLGLGLGLVFLKEYLDNTIRSVDYLEKLNLTVLGVIPEVGAHYRKKDSASSNGNSTPKSNVPAENGFKGMFKRPSGDHLRRHLVTSEDPKSPVSESYRMIRTNILYSKADEPIKSILVSSPGPGEGKTTTVTNLAITFANLGKRTLLLDVDLRRPVVHRIFDIERDPGISHYLSSNTDNFESLINKTNIENLYVVPAGITPPNPSELLGSKRMTDLIVDLKTEWDMVLIDSPPITAVTDATMVSHEVDSLVLVVKAGNTIKESLIRALNSLKGLDIKLAGVVLNGVSKETSYDSYYYYYQYYYHYYGGSKT